MAYRIFRRKRYIVAAVIGLVLVVLIVARLYLSVWLLGHVNKALANMDGYHGSVEGISIDLYRGAYRIHKLVIVKKNAGIPTPFMDIAQIDLSLQWGALLHGRIVSDIALDQPIITFATSASGAAKQSGAGVDWNKPIRELMPIDINVVTFTNGKLSYRDFSASPKVDIYINRMHGELRNLRNVVDTTTPLPSSIVVAGDSIGKGTLHIAGHMNILKPVPDMDLDAKLENANLVALTDYSNAYAAIDIKKGKLSVYSELSIKNNRVSGYVKPIATDVSLIDLRSASNPIKLVWESTVAVVVAIFTNHRNDQFATKIPLEGSLDNISTDTWSAISGIIRNAFIEAFDKGFDRDKD
ncbi:MAG: DUF748 domain-containing protein [Pseudomonadota bacterium]